MLMHFWYPQDRLPHLKSFWMELEGLPSNAIWMRDLCIVILLLNDVVIPCFL